MSLIQKRKLSLKNIKNDNDKVFDIINNINVSLNEFLKDSQNKAIRFESKIVGFNFKKMLHMLKNSNEILYVPCIFTDQTPYSFERNFFTVNQNAIEDKFNELDDDKDGFLTKPQLNELFKSFGIENLPESFSYIIDEKDYHEFLKKAQIDLDLIETTDEDIDEILNFYAQFIKEGKHIDFKAFENLKNNISTKRKLEKLENYYQHESSMLQNDPANLKKINKFYIKAKNYLLKNDLLFDMHNIEILYRNYELQVEHYSEPFKYLEAYQHENIFKNKVFQNEIQKDIEEKRKKYLDIRFFGFSNSFMIAYDDIINMLHRQQLIKLNKTGKNLSFIKEYYTLNNPDYYTNEQISNIINKDNFDLSKGEQKIIDVLSRNDLIMKKLKKMLISDAPRNNLDAVEAYARHATDGNQTFDIINRYLYEKFRHKEDPAHNYQWKASNKILQYIQSLDEVFTKWAPRSPEFITVYRHTPHKPSDGYQAGFISTTADPGVIKYGFNKGGGIKIPLKLKNEMSNDLYEIKIRPGTPYLPIILIGDELEILLPRGIHYKVHNKVIKATPDIRRSRSTLTQNTYYEIEAYLPPYDSNDAITQYMETPNYNQYYNEVCKTYEIVEIDNGNKLSNDSSPKASSPKASSPKASSPKASSPKASSPIEEDELSIPVDKKCPRGYTRNKKTGKCAKKKVKFTLKQTL